MVQKKTAEKKRGKKVKQDEMKTLVARDPSEFRIPENAVILKFRFAVTTSNAENAGTDAHVFLTIAGHDYQLDHPNFNDFERGQTDSFDFPPASPITYYVLVNSVIRLWHDNNPKKKHNEWHVKEATLEVQLEGINDNFIHYQTWTKIGWISKMAGLNKRLQPK